MKQAYGFIETKGMCAAITATDIALKAANVSLIGLELTRGMGYTVVKVQGDVAAVAASIQACKFSDELINKIESTNIIARPSDSLELIVRSQDTKGVDTSQCNVAPIDEVNIKCEEVENIEAFEVEVINVLEHKPSLEDKLDHDKESEIISCNICKDPKCGRKKGELRNLCLNFGRLKEDKK